MSDNNTVPLGRAGTGAAYIYGKSKSVDDFVNNARYMQKQDALAGLQKQKQAIELSKSLKDNAIGIEGNTHYNDELLDLVNRQKDNSVYYLSKGIDVTSDPKTKTWRDDQNKLLQMADMAKKISEYEKQKMQKYAENPDGYYAEDVVKNQNFYKENSLRSIIENGLKLPDIRKKVDETKIINSIPVKQIHTKEVVNGKTIEKQNIDTKELGKDIVNAIKATDGGEYFFERTTGMKLDDLETLSKTPNGVIKGQIMAGDWKAKAAQQGITFNDAQEADDYINKQVNDLAQKRDWYIEKKNEYARLAVGDKTQIDFKTPFYPPGYGKGSGSETVDTKPIDKIQTPIATGTGRVGNYTSRNFFPIQKASDMNFVGSKFYDSNSGKWDVEKNPSVKYSVTGFEYVPFINGKARPEFINTISQPNWEKDHKGTIVLKRMARVTYKSKDSLGEVENEGRLIPFDQVPLNFRNSKSVKEALKNMKTNDISLEEYERLYEGKTPQKTEAKPQGKTNGSKFDPTAYFKEAMKNKK